MVQFNVNLTKKDIIAARLIVFFHSRFGLVVVLFALALALANYTFTELGSRDDGPVPGATWLPLLIALLIVPGAVALAGINSAAVRSMLASIEYRLDEGGLDVVTPRAAAHFAWSQVHKAYESRHYLVFTTPGAMQIIPKRCAPPDTLAALKAIAGKSLGARARLRL